MYSVYDIVGEVVIVMLVCWMLIVYWLIDASCYSKRSVCGVAVLGGMYIIWQSHSHDTIAQLKAAHLMHNDVEHSE